MRWSDGCRRGWRRVGRGVVPGSVLALALLACSQPSASPGTATPGESPRRPASSQSLSSQPPSSQPPGSSAPSSSPAPSPTTASPTTATNTPTPTSRPEPRRSFVTIPALGLRAFPVVRYPGSPDDGPGTRIQNGGPMASPRGPRGGVGPGETGNFIVTGHRLSGTAPLRHSPSLRRGDRVLVRTADVIHVYEIRRTRWTSFRSPRSLAAQRAPVPGRPGVVATRPMLTLSTCATPEDHAAGNYWADEHDNPEHRIDKIGVLVASRPA